MADKDKEINEACVNNKELDHFKLTDLKKYLANRRLNVSGRKCELIERIIGAHKLDITDNDELKRRDQLEKTKRDSERYILPSGKGISPPWTLSDWSENIEMFPDVCEKDVYNYIVLKMNSKRQLKSRVFYEDGHVQKVEINTVCKEASHCYVRASVLPSFPTADKRKSPEYQPWVLLSKVTGCIHSAFCNCPAGEGECCNHIGALLYGLEDLTQKKENVAPTSKPCTWSNFSMLSAPRKRKLSPRKSDDVILKNKASSVSCRRLPIDKDHPLNKENGCTVNIERFKQRLESGKLNAGWLKNFPSEKEDKPVLACLNSVEFNYNDSVDLKCNICQEVFHAHFSNLYQSAEDVMLIEILTRGQNNSEWKEARRERLTSSFFGKICKRKDNTPPDGLLQQMLYSAFTNQYTEYGKKHEKVARKMYVKSMQRDHKGLIVKECGLYVNTQKPHLGASPDGLVYCSHCEESVGLIEIKCPASKIWRMQTPEQCCEDKDFFCHMVNGALELKKTHIYYYQVQGQMGVTGKKWCDFVVWTCVGLHVQRIPFDELFWINMCLKLDKFYVEAFIPELYSRRVQRGLKLFS